MAARSGSLSPPDSPGPSNRRRQYDDELDISDALQDPRSQHSRNSSIRSIEGGEALQVAYRDDDNERIFPSQQPSSVDPKRLAPLSTVSSLVRRMTTMKSPLTGTRFRTLRRSRQYETLDEGEEMGPGPVDLSSLEGLGYELRDVAPAAESRVREEQTEYVSPASTTTAKPAFRDFVNKRRSMPDGIGEGMRDVGAQLRRNPTKAPARTPSARDDQAKAIDRHKTVRNIGQKLASEKNTIVEVNENAIDLSQFEGPQAISFRSSTASSFEQMLGNRASTMGLGGDETKSYFFPPDIDKPNWKPFPMRTTYISMLIILATAIAVVQEVVCQISIRRTRERGGLIAFDNVAEVPTLQFFAWKCESAIKVPVRS
jgi:hypothetical protein